MPVNDGAIMMENVRIVFRNFSGVEKIYNTEGNRNFNVVLDDEMYEKMLADGWKVKTKPPREDGDSNFNVLQVKVSFKGSRPPRIVMISSRGRTTLDESTCGLLDFAEIDGVDLIIRPYDWTVNGNTGRKAYLKAIYVTIHEDALELKYADIQEIGQSPRFDDPDEEEFE